MGDVPVKREIRRESIRRDLESRVFAGGYALIPEFRAN